MIQEDIAELLEAQGFGVVGESIFLNRMANTPNNAIIVSLLPGFPFSPKIRDVTYSIQIMLRYLDYEQAALDSNSIANFFDNGESRLITAASRRKMICKVVGAPYLFNIDESGRAIYSIDLHVTTLRD